MVNEEARNPNQPTPEEKRPGNVFLFYVVPFLLLNLLVFFLVTLRPKFELHIEEPVDFRSAETELEMYPRLLLAAFDVKLDDTPLNLENLGGGHYKASVDKNGTLEVTIRYINGMGCAQYEHIGSIDDQPPLISGEEPDDNMLIVGLDGAQSDMNYDSIYGVDASEERVFPCSIDDVVYTAVFQITTDCLGIHTLDKFGHEAVHNFSEPDAMGNGGDNSHEYHTYGADEKKQGGTAVEDEMLESEWKWNSGRAEQSKGQIRATKESMNAARTSTVASTKTKESQTAAKTSTAAPTRAKESQTAVKTSTVVPTKAKESSAVKQTSATDTKVKETSASAGTKARENSAAVKQTSVVGTKTKESSTTVKPGNKANAVNDSSAPALDGTVSGGKNGPEKSTESKKSTFPTQVVEPLNL